MAGTYLVEHAVGYNDPNATRNPASGGYQYGERVSFTNAINIKSAWAYYISSGGANSPLHQFQIYRVSDGVKLYQQNCWLSTTVGWQEFVLNTPQLLQAGVEYSIGYYVPIGYDTNMAYDLTGGASYLAGQSTPAGITSSWYGSVYFTAAGNGVSMPATAVPDNVAIRLGVDLNALPIAPTALATNSPVTINNPINASWTHNDPDSNPQVKYQIRYRKV